MGTFLCIATNEVPPAVSKRITLDVNCEQLRTYIPYSSLHHHSIIMLATMNFLLLTWSGDSVEDEENHYGKIQKDTFPCPCL